MVERRRIAMVTLILMVVVALVVPMAEADACNDECYIGCEKGKKEDVPFCTNTCDDMCRLKAMSQLYAAATPAKKAAIGKTVEKEAAEATFAAAAPAPGFARLNTGCLHECHINLCSGGKKQEQEQDDDDDPASASACTTRCDNVCRAELEGLAFAAKTYAQSPAAEKDAIIQAIDEHASGPSDEVETFAATCINDCNKLCEEDPACLAICDDGCRGRSVNLAFSLSTPAQKEAINKDIKDDSTTANKLVGTAS